MFKNKTVIITGGASGIGRQIAKRFCEENANVVIVDIDEKTGINTAKQIKSIFIKSDVSNPNDVKKAIEKIINHFGTIHILVNNAGICPIKKVMEITPEEWDKVLSVNLKSVFLCSQAVIPYMIKNKYGRIINMSSLAGKSGGVLVGAHYSASKAGIIALSKVFAKELANFGITVNCVAPGTTETDLLKNFTKKQVNELISKIPLGRLGKPEDIAEVVLFLASEKSSFITGATIDVNGGLLMD